MSIVIVITHSPFNLSEVSWSFWLAHSLITSLTLCKLACKGSDWVSCLSDLNKMLTGTKTNIWASWPNLKYGWETRLYTCQIHDGDLSYKCKKWGKFTEKFSIFDLIPNLWGVSHGLEHTIISLINPALSFVQFSCKLSQHYSEHTLGNRKCVGNVFSETEKLMPYS